MKNKIFEKFPDLFVLDLRTFNPNQFLIRNSVWFGLPGLQYGWISALMDKEKEYGVYIDDKLLKNR